MLQRLAVIIVLAAGLSGCGLPVAILGSLIGYSIQATFHIVDDGVEVYAIKKGVVPKQPAPDPTPPVVKP